MTREEYLALSDKELLELSQTDTEAYYYYYLRHRTGVFKDIPRKCGKRIEDIDYYGEPEGGNR